MARTFRQRRQMHAVSELNVTNLVDLAFVLLIVFMLAAPLLDTPPEQTIPVNLPVESKSPQAKTDPDTRFEIITVRASGGYSLGNRTVALAELDRELARVAGTANPPVIRFRMDANSTAQQYISVMDLLKKHNLTKWTLDTQVQKQ
ncbi:ExbD/TolR family protein [Opitutaceae bacterium]